MAAQTLEQALEGVHFPCDRAQLIDYARRNNIAEGTLAVLEAIPERRYRDIDEVFTALPERLEEGAEAMAMPLEWMMQGVQQATMPWEVAAHCLCRSAETWPQWLRLAQRLWFPWAK